MSCLRKFLFVLLVVSGMTSGCDPVRPGPAEEQKDSHFLAGERERRAGNVKGALEAYEQALQANPDNSAAHLELGLLHEKEKSESDYAAAIYHFQKYVQLRPNSGQAEFINSHIVSCKQELAKSVAPALLPQTAERELMSLLRTNEALRKEVDLLRSQYSAAMLALGNQTARAGSAVAGDRATASGPQTGGPPMRTEALVAPAGGVPVARSSEPPAGSSAGAGATGLAHVIARGDTLASIARRYGVALNDLRSANPGVEDRRLQVGRTLRLPAH